MVPKRRELTASAQAVSPALTESGLPGLVAAPEKAAAVALQLPERRAQLE
jgi:hypothetical protein